MTTIDNKVMNSLNRIYLNVYRTLFKGSTLDLKLYYGP